MLTLPTFEFWRRHDPEAKGHYLPSAAKPAEAPVSVSRLVHRGRFTPGTTLKSTHHLDRLNQPILDKLEALAKERNLDMKGLGWILAQPPTWGLGFNPLSVCYLHDANHQPSAMVLEVRNTPWRERTLYWLTGQQEVQQAWEKTFHVSPFNPAGQSYRIQARWPVEDFPITPRFGSTNLTRSMCRI